MTYIKVYTLYTKNFEGNEVLLNEFYNKLDNSITKETIALLTFTRINIREALLL